MKNLYVIGRGILLLYSLVYLLGSLWFIDSVSFIHMVIGLSLGITGLAASIWPRASLIGDELAWRVVTAMIIIFSLSYVAHLAFRISEPSSFLLEVLVTEGLVIVAVGLLAHEVLHFKAKNGSE